jgi:hypothetical protein
MTEQVLEAAQLMLACLQVAMENAGNTASSYQFLPGEQATADISQYNDLCCPGTAYLRIASVFPSGQGFPQPDSVVTNCPPLGLGVIFELGVMRCSPAGSLQATPTAAEWLAAATQQMNDQRDIRTAICTFRNLYGVDYAVIEGTGSPVGPEGACLIWNQSVSIQIIGCTAC